MYIGITNQETGKLEIFPDKLPLFTGKNEKLTFSQQLTCDAHIVALLVHAYIYIGCLVHPKIMLDMWIGNLYSYIILLCIHTCMCRVFFIMDAMYIIIIVHRLNSICSRAHTFTVAGTQSPQILCLNFLNTLNCIKEVNCEHQT